MAGTTGFEPATSDVTGRRSNQLSYVPANCRNPQNTMIVERIARQLPLRVSKFQHRPQFPLCQSSPRQILRLLPCVANLFKRIVLPRLSLAAGSFRRCLDKIPRARCQRLPLLVEPDNRIFISSDVPVSAHLATRFEQHLIKAQARTGDSRHDATGAAVDGNFIVLLRRQLALQPTAA